MKIMCTSWQKPIQILSRNRCLEDIHTSVSDWNVGSALVRPPKTLTNLLSILIRWSFIGYPSNLSSHKKSAQAISCQNVSFASLCESTKSWEHGVPFHLIISDFRWQLIHLDNNFLLDLREKPIYEKENLALEITAGVFKTFSYILIVMIPKWGEYEQKNL